MTDGAESSLLGRLRHHGSSRPSKVALVDSADYLTYGDLWERVAQSADRLQRAGIAPHERVALALEPSAQYVTLLLAALATGATPAPINTRLAPRETREYLSRVDPAVVLTDLPRPELGSERIVSLDTLTSFAPETASQSRLPQEGSSRNSAIAFPTGGTTGTPKAALWSCTGLDLALESACYELDVIPDDVELYLSPFFHITMVTGLLATLYAGGTVRIMERFDAAQAAQEITGGQITRLFGTPTVLGRILEHAEPGPHPGVRSRIVFGAARSTPSFVERLMRCFPNAQFYTGYGATEFGAVTRLYPQDFLTRLRGVGRPVRGVALRVVDADRSDVGPNEVGEVIVDSPWAATGYLGGDEQFPKEPGGGIHSGDLGMLDEDGYLHLVGRLKEMIKTGGENVFPSEVEAVLLAHPAIEDAAVFGLPDEDWGERVEALVVLKPGASFDAETVLVACRRHLAGFKVPKHLNVIDAMPYTPNMKLDRRRVREIGAQRVGS